MKPTTLPERISWAYQLIDVRGTEKVLEIGCGPGVAVDLVAASLTTGHITGIDRSATAIARAQQRTAAHIASGRVTLLHTTLAGLALPARSIDTAFAINVNVFWTTQADQELHVLATVLDPAGTLHLIYETPEGPSNRAITRAEENLRRHGFTTSTRTQGRLGTVSGRRRS